MTEQELKDSTSSIARFAVEIIDAKNAEIARLREGLQSIVDYEGESWMDFNDRYCELREIAENALKGGSGE